MNDFAMCQEELPFAEYTLDQITENACETLKTFEPPDGYWGCFSGGKDSCVIKHLAKLAGVAVEWHYNVTTIDPPDLIYFMRKHHGDVIWGRPQEPLLKRIVSGKRYPTRVARWCCAEYKEGATPVGRRIILGVRAAESPARAKRWKVCTYHRKTKEHAISPILYWTDAQVWDFIHHHELPYCKLYDMGFKRLGCIACPMSSEKETQRYFDLYPGYERSWRLAFWRLWDSKAGTDWKPFKDFSDADHLFRWWVSRKGLEKPPDDDCLGLFDA